MHNQRNLIIIIISSYESIEMGQVEPFDSNSSPSLPSLMGFIFGKRMYFLHS